MIRFITPIILIGIAVTTFFTFTNPLYTDIKEKRLEMTSYNEALNNSKALENERDKLTAKYNSINPENLFKLEKLVPDNIDNIRLILEIEQIAAPYGMVLKDVEYSTIEETLKASSTAVSGAGGATKVIAQNKDYGAWDLQFSTSGTYNNFLNFLKDLEKNLRVVDISSIDFTAGTGSPGASSDMYK